jgi:RNA recognition motif-containing protein
MTEDDDKTFRCLKIRNIDSKIPEEKLQELIYEQFEPFDQFNIKFVHKPELGRAAYLNFKYIEDAEAALEQHGNIELGGMQCKVVPIYQQAAERCASNVHDSRHKSEDRDYDRRQDDYYGSSSKCERSRNRPEPGHSDTWSNSRPHGFKHSKYSVDRRPGRTYSGDTSRKSFTSHSEISSKYSEISSKNAGDEKCPCRNLYIGSLDAAITESDLRDLFSRYGIVQCVELKRNQGGGATGNYAFVRFFNLYMAQHAKSMMTGRYIGQSVPRLGYGTPVPTRCVWVGGIGSWTSVERLRSEFSEFGEVDRVVWPDDRNYAYVEFCNLSDARKAYAEMNGFLLGREKLILDFVDVGLIDSKLNTDERTNSREGPLSYQRQRHSRSPFISDKTRRSRSPLNRYSAERGNKMSGGRGRRPFRVQTLTRQRSFERRRTPLSDTRSVSPGSRSDRSAYSSSGSPAFNSASRGRKRASRSRSPRSNSSSERVKRRSQRTPDSPGRTLPAKQSSKKRDASQPKDERTVVLKQPPEPVSVASNLSVPSFMGPVPPHYVRLPPYGAPFYPPVVANPSYPPPFLPAANFFVPQATTSSMFPPPHVPPPGPSVGNIPSASTVRQTLYHGEGLPDQQVYNEQTPLSNANKQVAEASQKAVGRSRQSDFVVINFPKVWSGALVLKNGAFVINLHLVSGSVVLVNSLLGSSTPSSGTDCPVLKIAQRLRLDQPEKLDELDRRLRQAGRAACSVLLATPAQAEVDDASNVIQQRPLQSLVTYLCQKEVAAVVPLPSGCAGNAKVSGVLHAFPPCQFARKFLQREAPGIEGDYPAEDQLLIVVCESTLESRV